VNDTRHLGAVKIVTAFYTVLARLSDRAAVIFPGPVGAYAEFQYGQTVSFNQEIDERGFTIATEVRWRAEGGRIAGGQSST
jgi:hypothetical protein